MKQKLRLITRILIQIALLTVFWAAGTWISQATHSSIPGSLIGMALLLVGLGTRVLPLAWIETGSAWLLSELVLLYIPTTIGVIQYPSIVMHDGLRLLLALTISTLVVMAGSMCIVAALSHKESEME